MNRTQTRSAHLLTAALTALLLGGCTMTFPNNAPTHGNSSEQHPRQKTGIELRTQIIDYLNNSITASGIPDGWTVTPPPSDLYWDPPIEYFPGQICGTTGNVDTYRFDQGIYHDQVGDPIEFAYRMVDHWKKLGYEVSFVGDPPAPGNLNQVRADLPNGAILALSSTEGLFTLSAHTECSTDPSLNGYTGPNGYESRHDHDSHRD